MVMFILLNNLTTYAENVHHFVLSTNGPFPDKLRPRDWEILNCIKLTQHYKMH
jgi:hypothetical protein